MKLGAKPQAAVGWGLLFFAGLQLALVLCVDQWQPVLRDAQYGRKLALLEMLHAEHRGQPLVLMLGSSRTAVGFRADELFQYGDSLWRTPGADAARLANQAPIAFNFGLPAAGPLKQRQCLESLLRRGCRPDLLLVEIMPPLFNAAGPERFCEENWLDVPGLAAADVRLLRTYFTHPPQLAWAWARSRVLPCYRLRRRLMTPLAADWLAPLEAALPADPIDRFGWQRLARQIVSAEERVQQTNRVGRTYAGACRDYRIGAKPRRALEDLLERCRQEHVPVVLVRMPEGSTFRGWNTAETETAMATMLTEECHHYAVRLLDARDWIADEDFWDGHHLLSTGATQFTKRLLEVCLTSRDR